MPKRNKLLLSLLMAVITIFSFLSGCWLEPTATPEEEAFASIEQAWNIIINNYVENDSIDVNQLKEAVIEGMLEALDDPHSAYLNPQQYQSTFEEMEGKYEGIGAEVTERDGQIIVVAPFAGSPAEAAGILPGDVILEVGGVAVAGMDL